MEMATMASQGSIRHRMSGCKFDPAGMTIPFRLLESECMLGDRLSKAGIDHSR